MNYHKVILVTGGAGYIGSQTVKELVQAGYVPIVYDNLSTGHREAIKGIELIKGDLGNLGQINAVLKKYQPQAVIHLAASLEVEESVKNPEKYFQNNIVNGFNLLRAMRANQVNKIIFSSSAAVYGDITDSPIPEDTLKTPLNPYGLTKLIFEQILESYHAAYGLKSIALRYFNAAGADSDGQMGQDYPTPTHLINRVLLTALGQYPRIDIFGDDYATPDGSCVRDYIHVKDLALAHILALKALERDKFSPAYNLGTGSGYSVKEVVAVAQKITNQDFPFKISKRRLGDPAELVAANNLSINELGFKPKHSDLETIIQTAWLWHKNHPHGYGS